MNTSNIPPFEESVRNLITKGYGIFQAPVKISDYIQPIFNDFKQLIAESAEFKKQWEFHVPVNGKLSKKPDRGLVHPKGDGYDIKWTFMYDDTLKELLYNRFSPGEITEYLNFLDNLSQTTMWLKHMSHKILREVDTQLPGYDLYKQVSSPGALNMHVVRLLEYLYQAGAPAVNPMASLHTDQSCFTMQWFESHRGLVLIDYKGNKIEYNYEPGKVIAFWGKKAPQATNDFLKPVEHYVDSRAEADRNSGIYFVHTEHDSVEMR